MNQLRPRLWTLATALTLSLACAGAAVAPARGAARSSQMPQPTAAPAAQPTTPVPLPTMAARTAGLERKGGLLDLYLDRKRGQVLLAVPPPSGPRGEVGTFLYVEALLTGLGSNPVGLDRGQLGDPRIVTFRRVGGRLLVEQPNLRFRALSQDPEELEAVRESFATSILWAGEVAALDPDGSALVDFTPFLVRDAHDVAARLRAAGQGTWMLDEKRSVADLENVLVFPKNVELESLLTFQSSEPGQLVRETAPAAGAVTLVLHQSILVLPEPGFEPRPWDARAGSYAIEFLDYAAPLTAPVETRWIARHRLEKVDPAAARSRVKNPIVYYVDSGAPEPVRSALVEGASWWREAFERAGFADAYRVELLPPDAHPLDARYNVIQWVHRSTRGWSYGGGVIDPRTGEIVKGQVTLGSLRVRQDRLLFEGLVGADKSGSGGPDDPVALALARIRQLAAHEVGHALGLSHNFAASSYGRASVMDYPAPLVQVTPEGELDLSRAYGTGVGAWDVHAIRYAYTQFPPGAGQAAALEAILREGTARGLLFLSDLDARTEGAAQPVANLWDNGEDAVTGLEQALRVREIALARFGAGNVARGQPLAFLQEVLAPVYFHHRYQLDAAAKAVGGLAYTHAVRDEDGDGQAGARPVPAEVQRRALRQIAGLLAPERLDLPEEVLALLLPRPADVRANVEMFGTHTAPAFDALGAAATAADLAVRALLVPERAARLVDFHRRDPALPGLEEALDTLVAESFGAAPAAPRRAELQRTSQWVVARGMIRLARDEQATPAVRARVDAALADLRGRLRQAPGAGEEERAHRAYLAAEIGRYLDRRMEDAVPLADPLPPPPGAPIGAPMGGLDGCAWGG